MITAEPTLLEQVHALEVTAHRLAAERDHAVAERADLLEANLRLQAELDCAQKMAAQATKDLVRERHAVTVRDTVIKSLRIDADSRNAEIRRLNTRVHELSLVNEDQQCRLDRNQQEPKPPRQNWFSRRIGNQL